MKIVVIGLGYVGLVSAACLSKIGHTVVGVEIIESKLKSLNNATMPISEPGLDTLIKDGLANGSISFSSDLQSALIDADVALICVGTPTLANGDVDESQVLSVLKDLLEVRDGLGGGSLLVINRSTCPLGLHEKVKNFLDGISTSRYSFGYCVHPEFLREARAIDDFFAPPKIVFGLSDNEFKSVCEQLYLGKLEAPEFFVDIGVASFVKYADNCFHALKVTFANEIGLISKSFDVDSREVMNIFCADTKLNISSRYFKPGLPFGGSCLPKDLSGMNMMANAKGVSLPMMKSISLSNDHQIQNITQRIIDAKPSSKSKIGIYGLTFKKNTGDTRSSPVVNIVQELLSQSCVVSVFDPILSLNEDVIDSDLSDEIIETLSKSFAETCDGVEVLVLTQDINEGSLESLIKAEINIIDLTGCVTEVNGNTHGLYW